jgi:RIP metalloprotease RseP
LGHFLTAKRAGIKVEEFGFGFPPRLWGTRRGETEYTINMIPFACFVRMAGEDDPSLERSFASAKKRWRAAVLFAGPLVNIFLAVLLFAGAYMAGAPTPTEVQVEVAQVVAQSPAEKAGLQWVPARTAPPSAAVDVRNVRRESASCEVLMIRLLLFDCRYWIRISLVQSCHRAR